MANPSRRRRIRAVPPAIVEVEEVVEKPVKKKKRSWKFKN